MELTFANAGERRFANVKGMVWPKRVVGIVVGIGLLDFINSIAKSARYWCYAMPARAPAFALASFGWQSSLAHARYGSAVRTEAGISKNDGGAGPKA
jgi:hypothetical protein